MATYLLVSCLVHTPPGSSDFVANDVVNAYWDDSSSTITLTKNGSPYTYSSASQIGILNTNYYVSGITSYEGEYAVSGYSFCSGNDLKWFRMLTDYPMPPFMETQTVVDSPVCGTNTCDIHFVGAPQITHCTDLLSANGQIIVSASSSNGTVKYGLFNFRYADQGQTSGTITGLTPGTYTVYAKDANDCTAHITVTVLFKPVLNEHYRMTWDAKDIGPNGVSREERLRIYEREYVGDLVEVDHGGGQPFNLSKPKVGELNDKFTPIHPTNAVMALMAEVNYQFLPLFTEDDKKFRVVYEVDEGSGFTQVWQGFIVPSVYQEDFVAPPYPTAFRLTDNVKLLERTPFTDDNGQALNGVLKLIKVIALIMKKTGLELSIRSGINIFEENHNTAATDDPLDQTYIDVACYRNADGSPFMCSEVLEAILLPFGARIFQYDSQWIIEEIDRATAEYAYRVFDFDGDYVSNSTKDPIVDIKAVALTNRAAFIDQDHSLEIVPSYGNVSVTSRYNYVGSIFTGSFEKQDLLSPDTEHGSWFNGIFTSEEGFRDWSLRMPSGVSGVSFGRVVLSEDGLPFKYVRDADIAVEQDRARSVGAFYFNAGAWSGNIRDAYIESAAKPFQYGPNDEVRIKFDYSTPSGNSEYPFMVLRFAIKIGSQYLQQDRTWSATEYAYEAYPQISTSMQTFEMYVKVPSVSAITDSTIQVRIYYYTSLFYRYGLPSGTNDPADGTDGETGANGLRAVPTVDIDYDVRADVRGHVTLTNPDSYIREFVELRISDETEEAFRVIHPDDFHATTNPKIWFVLSHINESNKTVDPDSHNSRDRLFYVDNVNVDAFSNGQAPPQEETIELKISKYVDEVLEVELYNCDLPDDIRNGKNMFNNYFRLSDGTPTQVWARSGVSESLMIQEILLRVLASNHSAPTFRLTGSFVNEFARIGIDNYIRLTKPGSNLSASNTTFTSDLTGWNQTGTGTSFVWTADNSGSAEVTLSGAVDSKKFYQDITHDGGYITITGNVAVVADSTNDREDILWALFFRGSSIVHTEKVHTFLAPTTDNTVNINHRAFAPGSITAIGFYIKNINGTGDCTYQFGEFTPAGGDITEVYQIADYEVDTFANRYRFELMQLSKSYISLTGIDTGGTNQNPSGGGTGGDYNHDYNSDFSGGIN